MKRRLLPCLAILLFGMMSMGWAAEAATPLTVCSQAPGNIVRAGTPIIFTVQGAGKAVCYTLTSYFGQQVASGIVRGNDGTATITLAALPPGYYDLTVGSDDQQTTVSMGVVIDRQNAPLPRDGRICSDACINSLVQNREYITPIAKMVRLAGIPWVRERLSWSKLEKSEGVRNWSDPALPYEAVQNAFAAEGVYIQQVWHDAPGWTHPNAKNGTYSPDDLRTVYKFAQEVAQRYAQPVQAWEMWNEPDIGFWSDLSDRYGGYVKATYLGLKAGNPQALCLPGALCTGYGTFAQRVYDNIPGYGDGFNWHDYTNPLNYMGDLHGYAPIIEKGWVAGKPIRMTEAGTRLDASDKTKHLLSVNDQHRQCQFVPQMAACGIAAGNEKTFFFILPEYLEGSTEFGALHRDLTPNPSFVALSAAANILGETKYLGEYRSANHSVSAFAFSGKRGNMLVLWAKNATVASIPTEKASVQVADIFGAPQATIAAADGQIEMQVGPDAMYLFNVGDSITKQLITPTPIIAAKPIIPSPVVLVGHDENRALAINRERDVYQLDTDAEGKVSPCKYVVDVYNFGKAAANGTLRLELPTGWQADVTERTVTVASMGRETLTFTVQPQPNALINKVAVSGVFDGKAVAPSMSFFMLSPAVVTPRDTRALDWMTASRWQKNNAAVAPTTITNADATTLQFSMTFNGGDRWVYPYLKFEQPQDLSGYEAVTFDYQCDAVEKESNLRLMLVDANGNEYISHWNLVNLSLKKQRAVIFFKDCDLFYSKNKNNLPLDLQHIVTVRFGGNFYGNLKTLNVLVSNFRLVKFE